MHIFNASESLTKRARRIRGHWYQNIYQPRIGKYSLDTADPFQFLEIGFFNGRGYQTYREFFTDKAEVHSMEISCLPEGKREEGKVRIYLLVSDDWPKIRNGKDTVAHYLHPNHNIVALGEFCKSERELPAISR